MGTLDRYVMRQILPPFLLALSVCTFVLLMGPMLEQAELLLAKGVPIPTVGFLLLTLVPQGLGVAIPIAILAGILIGLGRMSADRETVALLACGVSPHRILRPVLLLCAAVAAVDLFVMTSLIADANQTFREITFRLMGEKTEADIKPRVFYEGLPGKVLFVWDTVPGGGWSGVFMADTSDRTRKPTVVTADRARLVLNHARREVDLYFPNARQYVPGSNQRVYDIASRSDLRISVQAESVFGERRGRAVAGAWPKSTSPSSRPTSPTSASGASRRTTRSCSSTRCSRFRWRVSRSGCSGCHSDCTRGAKASWRD